VRADVKGELEALRKEVHALREERAASKELAAREPNGRGPAVEPIASGDASWDEIKHTIEELADEIGRAARDKPMLGMAAAFALGVLLGRLLPR
jgi:hypothetical protein